MRLTDRLALYYERGFTARRTSIETGAPIATVREQFRRFHRFGIQRLGRRATEWRPPRPYAGPEWIGVQTGARPIPAGPGWIGKRHGVAIPQMIGIRFIDL